MAPTIFATRHNHCCPIFSGCGIQPHQQRRYWTTPIHRLKSKHTTLTGLFIFTALSFVSAASKEFWYKFDASVSGSAPQRRKVRFCLTNSDESRSNGTISEEELTDLARASPNLSKLFCRGDFGATFIKRWRRKIICLPCLFMLKLHYNYSLF
jgi:hypothetical protein